MSNDYTNPNAADSGDDLDNILNEAFKFLGLRPEKVTVTSSQMPFADHPAPPDEFFKRLFQPEPPNARLMYRPGDKVKLIRPDLFGAIPTGAVGEVQSIEHPESAMASKGRHYLIQFDLRAYKIPLPEPLKRLIAQHNPELPPQEFYEGAETNFGVNDLELVEKGYNWRPGYVHPYDSERLAERLDGLTPRDVTNVIIGGLMRDMNPDGLNIAIHEYPLPPLYIRPDNAFPPVINPDEPGYPPLDASLFQNQIMMYTRAFYQDSARPPAVPRKPVNVDYWNLKKWFRREYPGHNWAFTTQTQFTQEGEPFTEPESADPETLWVVLIAAEDERAVLVAPARYIRPETPE